MPLIWQKIKKMANPESGVSLRRNYEGHPINKLLNGIILSIFWIWKIRDIRFVENLFMNINCEFHQGNIIMMTSPAFWTQSVSAVFYQLHSIITRERRALNGISRYEKNEQVHQADLFKRQNINVYFSTWILYSFKHLSRLSTQYERINCRDRCIGRHSSKQHSGQVISSQQNFLDSEQTFHTKHVLPVK